MTNDMIVLLPCPRCGDNVAMAVQFATHNAVPATASYPGDPAEVEVWGDDAQCGCGQWLTVDIERTELVRAVTEHLAAFAEPPAP